MYRYYQTGEKTTWRLVSDDPTELNQIIAHGAKKITILAVSSEVTDDTDKHELQYRGPWYADIDNKEDIASAILAARQLVAKLKERNVPDKCIRLYASGRKGIHVLVPETVFSTGRPRKQLPAIYQEMALSLYVTGLDFQVYSGGKGVTWRVANVQREDGAYPVPLTVEELLNLTPEKYAELVKTPRHLTFEDPDKNFKAAGLVALYEDAKKRVASKPKHQDPVPDEWLQQFQLTNPQCVDDLVSYKIKPGSNFNQASMQLAAFVARTGKSDGDTDTLVSRMASTGTSQTYSTPKARKEHVTGLVRYAQHKPSVSFACGAMRAVLATSPCAECPLNQQQRAGGQNGVNGEDVVGVLVEEDGYYIEGQEANRRVSNFILVPSSVYVEKSRIGKLDRRIATVIDVKQHDVVLGEIMLSEDAWNSKGTFIKEIGGIGNLMFLGTDTDVQRLKFHVYQHGEDMSEVVVVHESGTHVQEVLGRDIFVYIEPKHSINSLMVRDTHILSGNPSAPPRLVTARLPDEEDPELTPILLDLGHVNAPHVVALLLGWHSACFLKTHLMRRYMQFPLLNLWGNAGAGKTMTAVLFSALNGIDYGREYSFVSLPTISQWALISYCASATTVPRVLEEFNKSKMKIAAYNLCVEVLKSAYNGQAVSRGTLAKSKSNGQNRTGAEVIDTPLQGPLLVLSEQAPDIPALMHRMVQVNMSREGRHGCTEYFNRALRHKQVLTRLGKALMLRSLSTSIRGVEELVNFFDDKVPITLIERARYSYQICLVGLAFLFETLRAYKLNEAADGLEYLSAALIAHLETTAAELVVDKERSEVDAVIDAFAQMALLTTQTEERWLVEGRNYIVKDGFLYIEPATAHVTYLRFVSRNGQRAVIDNPRQFMTLVRQEKYFVSDQAVLPVLAGTRPLLKLDMAKMKEKGLDTGSFAKF